MLESKTGKGYLASGEIYFEFTASTSPALGTDEINLASDYPGFVAGRTPLRHPRFVMFTGGPLNTRLANGTASPISVLFADKPLPILPAAVLASSTATALFVIW